MDGIRLRLAFRVSSPNPHKTRAHSGDSRGVVTPANPLSLKQGEMHTDQTQQIALKIRANP